MCAMLMLHTNLIEALVFHSPCLCTVTDCHQWRFCWFQKGQGAPAREPVVSSQEQKEMMAYYYRKQEELKVSYNHIIVCHIYGTTSVKAYLLHFYLTIPHACRQKRLGNPPPFVVRDRMEHPRGPGSALLLYVVVVHCWEMSFM